MSDSTTLLRYVLAIVVGAAVAAGGVLYQQLATGAPVEPLPILTAALGALVTGLSTTLLPSLRGEKG